MLRVHLIFCRIVRMFSFVGAHRPCSRAISLSTSQYDRSKKASFSSSCDAMPAALTSIFGSSYSKVPKSIKPSTCVNFRLPMEQMQTFSESRNKNIWGNKKNLLMTSGQREKSGNFMNQISKSAAMRPGRLGLRLEARDSRGLLLASQQQQQQQQQHQQQHYCQWFCH